MFKRKEELLFISNQVNPDLNTSLKASSRQTKQELAIP